MPKMWHGLGRKEVSDSLATFSKIIVLGALIVVLFSSSKATGVHDGEGTNQAEQVKAPGKEALALSIGDAWDVIQTATSKINELVVRKNLKPIHAEVEQIQAAIGVMQHKSAGTLDEAHKSRAEAALRQTSTLAGNLHVFADAGDQLKTESELTKLQRVLKLVAVQYPPESLQASPLVFACPMHPEVTDTHASSCPKCGMQLVKQARRISFSNEPMLSASVSSEHPLQLGEKATVKIKLTKKDGTPVSLDDLQVVHTKKIHLLLVDSSLTDYHHEHPEPSDVAGEYVFSFTPKKPGSYRIWADVTPSESRHEYVITDLPGSGAAEPISNRNVVTSGIVDGLSYELSLDKPDLKVGQAIVAKIKISDQSKKPFTQLEPLMGAYAHLVGFYDDYKTVAHIHPMGEEPSKPTERGGPELEFHFMPEKPGLLKLFAQVQINGKSVFVPFALQISP